MLAHAAKPQHSTAHSSRRMAVAGRRERRGMAEKEILTEGQYCRSMTKSKSSASCRRTSPSGIAARRSASLLAEVAHHFVGCVDAPVGAGEGQYAVDFVVAERIIFKAALSRRVRGFAVEGEGQQGDTLAFAQVVASGLAHRG